MRSDSPPLCVVSGLVERRFHGQLLKGGTQGRTHPVRELRGVLPRRDHIPEGLLLLGLSLGSRRGPIRARGRSPAARLCVEG